VVPARERAATSLNSAGSHNCGFFAGANPSRNQASAHPLNRGKHVRASPMTSVSTTAASSNKYRCHPGANGPYWAHSALLSTISSGHKACARRMSALLKGNFSKLKKCSLHAGARRRHSRHAAMKFMPVPKPISPMTKVLPGESSAHRAVRLLPSRNTCRVSSRPASREK